MTARGSSWFLLQVDTILPQFYCKCVCNLIRWVLSEILRSHPTKDVFFNSFNSHILPFTKMMHTPYGCLHNVSPCKDPVNPYPTNPQVQVWLTQVENKRLAPAEWKFEHAACLWLHEQCWMQFDNWWTQAVALEISKA